jgi:hypothetical protein
VFADLPVRDPVDVDVMNGVRLTSRLDGIAEDGRVCAHTASDRHEGDNEAGRRTEVSGKSPEVVAS